MSWEKLDLHIENLIPGVVLLSVLVLGWPPNLGTLTGQAAILATAFIGSAYMLGAIDNLLARLLLDYVCRRTVRRFFMRALLGYRLELEHPTRTAIDKRYSAVITAGLSCGNARVEAEVAKRRQTTRIMRSALIPVIIMIWVVGCKTGWSVWQRLSASGAAYVALLLLYAYSEVAIFQEGYRGERTKVEMNQKSLPATAPEKTKAERRTVRSMGRQHSAGAQG